MRLLIGFAFVLSTLFSTAATLHVGTCQTYADPARAARDARPGDTILVHDGTYRGTFWIENLQGTADQYIVIRGTSRDGVRLDGGSESLHLSDCAYVRIEELTVTGQTANGMNIDDAGSIETPTHHIEVRHVTFTDMAASGNNDMLKLSGLEDFLIDSCVFRNGSAGGSGVDMVGCHRGIIRNCTFERQGSNGIQAKGGTQFLRIERNRFVDAGQRALNLGGSTGLQFFRPLDAPFEAADIGVYANIFVRSVAPIAYVGSVRVDVANNTIIDPERWVMRILQETVDTTRFAPCGQNMFHNNIVVMRNTLSTHVNIGSNTAPSTFTLANNLWYMSDNVDRSRPNAPPLTEQNGLYGIDPRFVSASDLHLQPGSPAISAGTRVDSLGVDFDGRAYAVPPSVGAFEGAVTSGVVSNAEHRPVGLVRTQRGWVIETTAPKTIDVYDLMGRYLRTEHAQQGSNVIGGVDTFIVVRDE
jgi:hypothetical protein